jgi:hypothetical protein
MTASTTSRSSLPRRLLGATALALTTACASEALALIPIPVGGHPKELDVFARVTLERGLVEPNENKASYQKANWEMLTVGGGYGLGDLGDFQDVSVRLEATGYQSPAEVNDPGRGPVAATACPGPSPGPGLCEFHSADRGAFITPSLSTNLIHTGAFSFGVFVLGNIPIGVNYKKFVMPRIDFVGGGFRMGAELAPAFAFETSFYVGSGASGRGGRQNGTFAATQLLHFRTKRIGTSPFFRFGVKVGPYVDGDLIGERTDSRYDQVYTAGYPDRTDRIRMFRFAATVLPYVQMSDTVSVELGYLQKIFGYDTPATQLYTATLRYVF